MSTDHPVDAHEGLLCRYRIEIDGHDVRVSHLEKVSAAREEQIKSLQANFDRIMEVCEAIQKQITDMSKTMEAQLKESICRIDERLKPLEEADARKWKLVSTFAISALTTGVIGYILGELLRSK